MNYDITLTAEQDDLQVRGNAMATDEPELDKECEDEILARLDRGNVWAWASVKVEATCPECGANGCDYLGGCSYEDEADFKRGAYYTDMVSNASEECRLMCTCRKPEGIGNLALIA